MSTAERFTETGEINIKEADQANLDLAFLELGIRDTDAALIALRNKNGGFPPHSRIPVVVVRKTEEDDVRILTVHLRHASADDIANGTFNIQAIGTPLEVIPNARENLPGNGASVDVIGGHAADFAFTGDLMINCVDLTIISKNYSPWYVTGRKLNEWDNPQNAISFLRQTFQQPDSVDWINLPLAI